MMSTMQITSMVFVILFGASMFALYSGPWAETLCLRSS